MTTAIHAFGYSCFPPDSFPPDCQYQHPNIAFGSGEPFYFFVPHILPVAFFYAAVLVLIVSPYPFLLGGWTTAYGFCIYVGEKFWSLFFLRPSFHYFPLFLPGSALLRDRQVMVHPTAFLGYGTPYFVTPFTLVLLWR